jgi:hypothetical protein
MYDILGIFPIAHPGDVPQRHCISIFYAKYLLKILKTSRNANFSRKDILQQIYAKLPKSTFYGV